MEFPFVESYKYYTYCKECYLTQISVYKTVRIFIKRRIST